MRYLIVTTLTPKAGDFLYYYQYATEDYDYLFPFPIRGNKKGAGSTKVMYNCDRSKVILARLQELHPNEFYVWEANILSRSFGEHIEKISKKLNNASSYKKILCEANFPEKFVKKISKQPNSKSRRLKTMMPL